MGEIGAEAFGLFVSSVAGHPVTRFGTKTLIGAERDPVVRNKIRYRTKDIIAIPHDEARRFAREYRRLIADGALTEHTAAEWHAQRARLSGAPPQDQPAPDPE